MFWDERVKQNKTTKITGHVSKIHKHPHPLVFAHMATTAGCINFNKYFPSAQSDLLYILTPSHTPGHDPGANSRPELTVKG